MFFYFILRDICGRLGRNSNKVGDLNHFLFLLNAVLRLSVAFPSLQENLHSLDVFTDRGDSLC